MSSVRPPGVRDWRRLKGAVGGGIQSRGGRAARSPLARGWGVEQQCEPKGAVSADICDGTDNDRGVEVDEGKASGPLAKPGPEVDLGSWLRDPPYGSTPSSRATPSSLKTAMLAYHLW